MPLISPLMPVPQKMLTLTANWKQTLTVSFVVYEIKVIIVMYDAVAGIEVVLLLFVNDSLHMMRSESLSRWILHSFRAG